MSTFDGFPREGFEFLIGLGADNTKAFFDAHRTTYLEAVAEPSRLFVDSMAPLLQGTVHPDLHGEAKAGRSLFRINRDVRFARDKTPYNTHVDLMWWIGDDTEPRSCPAVIMRLTGSTVLMGAGQHGLRGPALDRYRALLVDQEVGAEIRAVVHALVASGSQLTEPARTRPPKGFPADHPNADLARRDGFHAHHTTPHPVAIAGPGFAQWCADELARYRPLLALLAP